MTSDEEIDRQYKLTFELRPGYLYAYIEGEHDNYEITKAYWLKIVAEATRTGIRRILVDENLAENSNTVDVYAGASKLPEMFAPGTKIAFVDRFIEHNDLNEFGELVAVNRGANGRVFTDIAVAEKWLLD